jgi:hypothetical protein
MAAAVSRTLTFRRRVAKHNRGAAQEARPELLTALRQFSESARNLLRVLEDEDRNERPELTQALRRLVQ